MSSETLCFQCGQPAGDPLRLNHMPNGSVCPVCRDRLLDSLPAPFPAPVTREGEEKPSATLAEEGEEAECEDRPSTHLRAVPPPTESSDTHPFGDDGFKPSA